MILIEGAGKREVCTEVDNRRLVSLWPDLGGAGGIDRRRHVRTMLLWWEVRWLGAGCVYTFQQIRRRKRKLTVRSQKYVVRNPPQQIVSFINGFFGSKPVFQIILAMDSQRPTYPRHLSSSLPAEPLRGRRGHSQTRSAKSLETANWRGDWKSLRCSCAQPSRQYSGRRNRPHLSGHPAPVVPSGSPPRCNSLESCWDCTTWWSNRLEISDSEFPSCRPAPPRWTAPRHPPSDLPDEKHEHLDKSRGYSIPGVQSVFSQCHRGTATNRPDRHGKRIPAPAYPGRLASPRCYTPSHRRPGHFSACLTSCSMSSRTYDLTSTQTGPDCDHAPLAAWSFNCAATRPSISSRPHRSLLRVASYTSAYGCAR